MSRHSANAGPGTASAATSHGRGPVPTPAGATVLGYTGPRGFRTRVRYRMPGGEVLTLGTREYRKALSNASGYGLNWWIGLLFATGSVFFAIGPIPAYARAVGDQADLATYFIGSLFFTTAAYLSYLEVVRAQGHSGWFCWAPARLGFWATLIQFIGTVFFNVTTWAATRPLPDLSSERMWVWWPDAIGSICFLVSSAIAFAEAGHRWFSWRPGKRDWHVTSLNWWGSVFFGVSAVGAFILADGTLLSAQAANVGTFLGALCFFAASIVMMPEGRAALTPAHAPASG